MKVRQFPLILSSLLLISALVLPAPYAHAGSFSVYYDIANAPDNVWSLAPSYVGDTQNYLAASTLHAVNLNLANSSDLGTNGDFLFSWWSWNPGNLGYIEFTVTPSVTMSLSSMQYTFFAGNWSYMDGPHWLWVRASKDNFQTAGQVIRDASMTITTPFITDSPNDYVDNLSSFGQLAAGETLTIRFYAMYADYQSIPAGFWNKSANDYNLTLTMNTAAVPEPASMLLLGSGLAGIAAFRRKFKK
jgi:hypothetical protein